MFGKISEQALALLINHQIDEPFKKAGAETKMSTHQMSNGFKMFGNTSEQA